MILHIQPHLTKIKLIDWVVKMFEEYEKSNYSSDVSFDFNSFYNQEVSDSVETFVRLNLPEESYFEERGEDYENIVKYIVHRFYLEKGTPKIFELMRTLLNIPIKGNEVEYNVFEVVLNIGKVSTDNLDLYVDSLRGFIDSLIYYNYLTNTIDTMSLVIRGEFNTNITHSSHHYVEFFPTPFD